MTWEYSKLGEQITLQRGFDLPSQKRINDWTNPHRQDVLAKVTLAVKMVLMRENIKGEQLRFLTNAIIEKAKEKYKDWPMEA